jgi:hypothetical protein
MTSEDLTRWIACDKCGESAQAKWQVKMVDGELYFCGHHMNKYHYALDKVAFDIIELNKTEEVPQLEKAE